MQQQLLRSPSNFFYNLLLIILIVAVLVAAYVLLLNPTNVDFLEESYSFEIEADRPDPLAINTEQMILEERFQQDLGLWTLSPPDQAQFYGQGLLLDDNIFNEHAGAKAGLVYDDFILNVKARWAGGAIGGAYGIRFRLTEDNSFYAFYVHNDGRYTIARQVRTANNWVVFSNEYTDALETTGGVNTLQIEAEGDLFRFFINDTYIGTLRDDRIEQGDIELVSIKVEDSDRFMAGFDDLLISQLLQNPER